MRQVLLLVRHAAASFHPGRLPGWTPGVGLSEEGMRQAKALAERLRPVALVAAYSSPLERCVQTAQAVLEGRRLELQIHEGLGEVRYGAWEGRPFKALVRTRLWRILQAAPSQVCFPGGESLRGVQGRAVEAAEEIRGLHRRGVVALFSHADVIRALAAHYLGLHLDLYQRLSVRPASVTAIGFDGPSPRLLCFGDTGSYEWLSPPRRRR